MLAKELYLTMWIAAQLAEVELRPSAHLAVGFFDGVHRGHQAVLREVVERARAESVAALVVTCWPHPSMLLHPRAAPRLLTTRAERLERLRAVSGLDGVLDQELTPDFVKQSPDMYLKRLSERIDVRGIVTGPRVMLPVSDAVDLTWLRHAGAQAGFTVGTVELMAGGEPISASRIRKLVADGEVSLAAELLGAEYSVAGLVVDGDKRGRLLGFPTANLRLDPVKLVPARGIYAVWARLPGEPAARPAVASVGVRPTFGQHSALLVEVYLLDVELDLYGLQLEAQFVVRLREERKYAHVDELVAQMRLDVEQARTLLNATGKPHA
jgi:riboflavin kinase / FMN adenylyltransferase